MEEGEGWRGRDKERSRVRVSTGGEVRGVGRRNVGGEGRWRAEGEEGR